MLDLSSIKLPIESIPESTQGLSLANTLEKEEWDRIRRLCYSDANHKCKICGAEDTTLHCHEVWGFNDSSKIQKLKALVCVCSVCHDCIHYFRSVLVHKPGYITRLRNNLMELNKWTPFQLEEYIKLIRLQNHKRKKIRYRVIVGTRELK